MNESAESPRKEPSVNVIEMLLRPQSMIDLEASKYDMRMGTACSSEVNDNVHLLDGRWKQQVKVTVS